MGAHGPASKWSCARGAPAAREGRAGTGRRRTQSPGGKFRVQDRAVPPPGAESPSSSNPPTKKQLSLSNQTPPSLMRPSRPDPSAPPVPFPGTPSQVQAFMRPPLNCPHARPPFMLTVTSVWNTPPSVLELCILQVSAEPLPPRGCRPHQPLPPYKLSNPPVYTHPPSSLGGSQPTPSTVLTHHPLVSSSV